MFHGVLALVGRSLRVDARAWQTHLARLGLMAGIYIALCVAVGTALWFGAPGLRFFYATAYLNLTFMSLLGISFFSTPISEEKEEDLLGLMLMAGISPLGVLLGKSCGRLIQALLLIAVQYPFTLLAVTMGGVTQYQVSAAYFGLASYMVLLAGFGVLCSTVAPNNRTAASLMIIGIAIYLLVPLSASMQLRYLVLNGLTPGDPLGVALDRIVQTSVFQQMGTILTSGFGDRLLSWQVVSNLVLGLVSFATAWAVFGICSRQPSSEPITRGLVSRTRGRWYSPGRPWGNPFIWKDFHFVSGGLGMIPVRLAFCAGLYYIATLQPRLPISFYQVFLSLAIAIDAGRVMAGALHDEIRGQTLSSLIMLPQPTVFVVYSKFAGALLGWLPGPIIDLFVTVATVEGASNFRWIAKEGVGICITAFFVLIPHLSALLALYMRWGAVPLGTAIAIGLYIGIMVSLQPPGPSHFSLYIVGFFIFALSALCHVAIILRIQRLASGR